MSTSKAGKAGKRKGRVRRVVVPLLALILGVVAGAAFLGQGPGIGYWRSAEGKAAYEVAYEAALAEGPTPDETLDVRTDWGVVRALRFDGPAGSADAEPLVLLPGTQSGAPMWAANIPSLVEAHTVYVIDLLGQPGMSVQSRPIASHEEEAAWLAQVISQIPGEPAVVGHSLGGWLALNLAVHEPDAVSKVIVLDPVLSFGDLSMGAVIRSIPASVPWTPESWRKDFGSWTANDAPVSDNPTARMIEAGMQGFSLGSPAPTRLSEGQLAGIRAEVLVVMAGDSRMHDSAAGVE